MKKTSLYICSVLLGVLLLVSCEDNYTPKPKGYLRIALPEKSYQVFDDKSYPFSFDYPVYAEINPIDEKGEKYWMDLAYKGLNAKLHFSYRELIADTSLSTLIKGSLFYVNRHISKSSGIEEMEYADEANRVWGCIYEINGDEVASTYQFYLTDSNKHFVRAALYIEAVPNNDSLAPVISFLKEDVNRMVKSFRWK